MKTFKKIIAVVIAAAGVTSVAGCASTQNYKTATSANWNVRTSTSVEKTFNERWKNNMEVAKYSVALNKGANSSYSVNYTDGEYETRFYMTEYDWSAQDIPEGYKSEESKVEDVYVFETTLSVKGEYVLTSSGEKKEFADSIKTVCYYRPAGQNLQPVYSKQIIHDFAPNTLNAVSITNCYIEVDGEYTTYYDYGCTKAQTTFYNKVAERDAAQNNASYTPEVYETGVADKEGHSVFDNCQIRAAARAFTLRGGAGNSFNVYVPQNRKTPLQACYTSCSNPTKLDSADSGQAGIIAALKGAPEDYIFFDKTTADGDEEREFRYTSVSFGISADMAGANPDVWYAAVENGDINYSRCVMLRMSTPLPFGLGTIAYNLSSLNVEAVQK